MPTTHGTRTRPGHARSSISSPLLGISGGHRPALAIERFCGLATSDVNGLTRWSRKGASLPESDVAPQGVAHWSLSRYLYSAFAVGFR